MSVAWLQSLNCSLYKHVERSACDLKAHSKIVVIFIMSTLSLCCRKQIQSSSPKMAPVGSPQNVVTLYHNTLCQLQNVGNVALTTVCT